MRSSHPQLNFGLSILLVSAWVPHVATGQPPRQPDESFGPVLVVPPVPATIADAAGDRHHRGEKAITRSGGDVPELVFAEFCEEEENNLCPVTSFDFGTVAPGSSGPYPRLYLWNTSDSVSATGLSLQSDPEFPMLPRFNDCHLNPELPPGGSCGFGVKFAPTMPGPVEGTLTASSAEGAGTSLLVSGTGGSEIALHGQFHDWETMIDSLVQRNAVYTESPEWSAELADDFLVEDPEGWTISKVGLEVVSTNFLLEPQTFNVQFMLDDGGIPGDTAICSAPESAPVLWEPPFYERRVEITLSSPCVLPPGHYWLRARPTLSHIDVDGFIGWGLQYLPGTEEEPPGDPTVYLNPPVWRQPQAPSTCLDWTHIYPPACGLEDWLPFYLAYDAVFWLIGQTGEPSSPDLAFDPSSFDFGEVEVGTPGPNTIVTLLNTGNGEATGLSFSGLPDNGFEANTNFCTATLPPGGSCVIQVTFNPTGPGPATASLQASSLEGAFSDLALSGTGVGGAGFTPMGLEVVPDPLFADSNGVFEPGEVVEIAPAWRNDDMTPQSLTGTVSNFTGPPGAVYSLADGAADYGPVDAGATASCLDLDDCYGMSLDSPAPRPATHWDATFDEALSDGASSHSWNLHIGDSFSDVPRENLFYASIETLLHHGVTEGCAATAYCPAGANSRAQMAAFLLRATEGSDYTPPACEADAERFDDVPAGSIFCPWIEELAARGVTSGCGGNNYCPTASVTRAQMAVFLLRAAESESYTPPPCSGVFTDVPCPSTFAAWIEDLASRGVTSGCGAGTFCPGDTVTRAQMAVFLGKAFGLTLYGP